jgi:hypothetical protein
VLNWHSKGKIAFGISETLMLHGNNLIGSISQWFPQLLDG